MADKLIRDGYNAEPLHGDLSQQQRDITMQKFRQHITQLLVATDVAARGLDVDDLTHVINYGMPGDTESYTHRSGRTGRAGKKGTSISIIHTKERGRVREVERTIGKEFVDGTLPTPQEICSKQLFKAIDEIEKVDVDEEQIAPFMEDINRHEIVKPSTQRDRKDRNDSRDGRKREKRAPESGYRRLFINLGKDDGFYPGEVMQFINRNVHGRQDVGHIDLLGRISYIEVPEEDADKVMRALDGAKYRGRTVRCNDADSTPSGKGGRSRRSSNERSQRASNERKSRANRGGSRYESGRQDDWRQFIDNPDIKLVGDEPDFSEEGWARRKPRKKK